MVKQSTARPRRARKNTPSTAEQRQSTESSGDKQKKSGDKDGVRETVESIVVAFILAFLFRTFEAEAFVIPTGSMAPTLYGRHKEIECEQCGITYAVGASDEVDKDGAYIDGRRIEYAYCPNCRFRMAIEDEPVFKGDRILVNKFPYEFGEPDRWDVVVFKYPEEPQTNYIKRLVGLPGEVLQIRQGDVYRQGPDGTWRILHKDDPAKQRVLQQLVFDNDYPETALHERGWPRRWAAVARGESEEAIAGWTEDADGWSAAADSRSFQLQAERTADGRLRWLRYRHIVASTLDWEAVTEVPAVDPSPNPRPQLIADFCGYNAYTGPSVLDRDFGYYWVGDLTLNCQVDVEQVAEGGTLLLELNEGARAYRCRIDLATGKATLAHTVGLSRDDNEEQELASAETDVTGPGRYRLTFANVDDRLCLWVNDRLIEFGPGAEYQPYGGLRIQPPQDDDLIPVGIAARNASLTVSHLLLERDVYYRSELLHPQDQFHDDEDGHGRVVKEYIGNDDRLHDRLGDPREWFREYADHLSRDQTKYEDVSFQFALGEDEFFMMGDNSPRSKDSRLWSNSRRAEHRHAVPRSALVGKAFFIYWPHGVPFLNDGKGIPVTNHKEKIYYERKVRRPDGQVEIKYVPKLKSTDYPSFRVPFYPHVGRMERIR